MKRDMDLVRDILLAIEQAWQLAKAYGKQLAKE